MSRIRICLWLAATACSPSPPREATAAPIATVSATASARAPAPPPYVPSGALLGAFQYRLRGYKIPNGLPLRSKLHVYEVECIDDTVADTFHCAPATGLLDEALAGNARGSFDLRRTRACFDVDVRRADAALVASVAKRDNTHGSDPRPRMKAGADDLDARAAKEGPTLYLTRMKIHDSHVPCPPCGGLDCCLGFKPTPAQRRAGSWSTSLNAQSSQPISVPSATLNVAGTLALYDGSPHARDVADLAKAGDWKSALELAQTEASAIPPDVRGYALANVAVCAFQAHDMTTLARALSDIEALGDRAPQYARASSKLLATAVSGEMWVDPDPCVP